MLMITGTCFSETTVGTQTATETMSQPTVTVAEFQPEDMSQEVTAAADTTEPAQPEQGEQASETTFAETTVADSAPQQVTEPPGGRDAEIQTTTKADTEARNSTGGQKDSQLSGSSNISETMTHIIKISTANLGHSTTGNSQEVYTYTSCE